MITNKMDVIPILLLSIILIVAVVKDVRFRKIPNWLTFPSMALSIVYHSITNGFSGLLFSFAGLGIGIALLIVPYLMGGIGAGDAKLMGVVGSFLGPKGVFLAFLITAIIGGVYAVLLLARYGLVRVTVQRYLFIIRSFIFMRKAEYVAPSEDEKKPRLRYGIAVAVGTLLSLFIRNALLNEITFK